MISNDGMLGKERECDGQGCQPGLRKWQNTLEPMCDVCRPGQDNDAAAVPTVWYRRKALDELHRVIASYCGGWRGRRTGTVGSLSLPHMYPVMEMDGVACGNAPLESSRRYVRNMFCLDGLGARRCCIAELLSHSRMCHVMDAMLHVSFLFFTAAGLYIYIYIH